MALIKNPISSRGIKAVNTTITVAVSTSSPVEILAYLNAVIADIPELQNGKYFAICRRDWSSGSSDRMCMFNTYNGSVETDTAIRINTNGNLSARAFSSTSSLSVVSGDTFEFIRVNAP